MTTFVMDERVEGRFLVNRRAMTDIAVLERERTEVFGRCWLYVGRESELAEPDTILTRTVGGRPRIFLRDADGSVRVLINSCTHRGNVVCRERATTGKYLRCFFHAWTFDTTGALVGVVDDAAYGPQFDKGRHALVSPRTESYRGFVFVCFDRSAPVLATYLAGACAYIDLLADQALDDGLEVLGGQQEYTIRANWKLLAENSVDGYHAPTTHKRWFDLLRSTGPDGPAIDRTRVREG